MHYLIEILSFSVSSCFIHSSTREASMKIPKLRIFQVIWFFFCTLGNIYQVEQISQNYFSYKISTSVMVNFPAKYIMPKLSMCIPLWNMIDWKSMEPVLFNQSFGDLKASNLWHRKEFDVLRKTDQHNFSRSFNRLKNSGFKMIVSHFFTVNRTNSDIMEILMKPQEIFGSCRLIDPKRYQFMSNHIYNCTNCCGYHFNIQMFQKEQSICYAFKSKHLSDYRFDYLSSKRAIGTSGIQFHAAISREVTKGISSARFYLTESSEYPRYGYTSYHFAIDMKKFYKMTYYWYKNQLLPVPYETGCIEYKSLGYTSRGDCFEKCFKKKSLERFNRILPGIVIDSNDNQSTSITPFEYGTNLSFSVSSMEIQKTCSLKCHQPDCMEDIFIPLVLGQEPTNLSRIAMFIIQTPVLTTICEPKTQFVEFLTDFISSFGFWLGISVLSVYKLFVGHILIRFSRFKDSVNSNLIENNCDVNQSIQILDQKNRTLENHCNKLSHQCEYLLHLCESIKNPGNRTALNPRFTNRYSRLWKA